MLITSILYYKKFRKDIDLIGFEVNPYDICVANRTVNRKQQTVTWHVDDLKLSHDFHFWCEKIYDSDTIGHVKVVQGKIHDYLDMILDWLQYYRCIEAGHEVLHQQYGRKISVRNHAYHKDIVD
jgi:hypothetical protein